MGKFGAGMRKVISNSVDEFGVPGAFLVISIYLLLILTAVYALFSASFASGEVTVSLKLTVVVGSVLAIVGMSVASLVVHLTVEVRELRSPGAQRGVVFPGIEPWTDLVLFPQTGQIVHGSVRHVLYRVGTFHEIVVAFRDSVEKSNAFDERLRSLGWRMGTGFGRDLINHLQRYDKIQVRTSLRQMILWWCMFDVSGGWGKWELVPGEDELKGVINIEHNYLTDDVSDILGDQSLCKMLEGYMSGVLEVIGDARQPGFDWRANVEEISECSIEKKRSGGGLCTFRYTLTKNPRSESHIG